MAISTHHLQSIGKVSSFIGALLLMVGLFPYFSSAQQIHKNPFESLSTSWIKGNADVSYVEKVHKRVSKGARNGQRSEYLQIEAKQGTHIYYQYPTSPAPISPELTAGVWVKSNRRNIHILARVVLPNARDPKSPDDRLTTVIRGQDYRLVGRWQKLEIPQPERLAQRQQQLMQARLKRAVSFKGAYVDRIYLNVYGGPGRNDVWIDDLQIGPVLKKQESPSATPGAKTKNKGALPTRPARTAAVEFAGAHLLVGGKRFFFRGIRHSDTPLPILRKAGFNAIWLPHAAPKRLREAASLGFWLVPSLPLAKKTNHLVSRNAFGREVARFPESDAVLFYDFGGSLVYEQASMVSRSARIVKTVATGRPVGGDVWDGFLPYSRSLDLVGAHRWPLMTELELTSYRKWLNQRRLLANPGTFMWTWIQNHTQEHLARHLFGQTSDKEFKQPIGPQPAQMRLLTYTALGAGYRGLAFWSDRFLADTHHGRDRLLECALLNKELEMLEPLLLTLEGTPQWIKTSEKNVKAAVLRTGKGILVLPMWLGKGAQYVPGQSAATKLKIVAPQVPPGMQAWEVTPGEVRGLRTKRVIGGTEITLPEFGLTTAVVFTSDTKLIVGFQEYCRATRQIAAQWTFRQAQQELEKVTAIQKQLQDQGRALPQSYKLIDRAKSRLKAAKTQWDNRLFGAAYRESQRALRPLRIVMRTQWDKATKGLQAPVVIPFGVSYYTLPKYWQMVDAIRRTRAGGNVLKGGDFEDSPEKGKSSGWQIESFKLDDVVMRAERIGKNAPATSGLRATAKKGTLCALLQITPKEKNAAIGALERTYQGLTSNPVRLQPGSLVRISAWIHIPRKIEASEDGVLFFDSAGGEPLALRLTKATPWKKFSLYRRVPAGGTIQVTMALSGLGAVLFDDVRIEPLLRKR